MVSGSTGYLSQEEFWAASFESPNTSRLTEDTGALDIIKREIFSPTMYNPDLVDEPKAMKEASWLSYMFDS
jgi:hypothetical protein